MINTEVVTLEHLKAIREELIKRKYFGLQLKYNGLCIVIRYLNSDDANFNLREDSFNKFLASTFKNKKVYYDYEYSKKGKTIKKTNDANCYYWRPKVIKPRLNWLDKQIKIKSK